MRRPSPVLFLPLMIATASLGAIIAAVVLFGSPAPAHANGVVLVSNIGQTEDLLPDGFAILSFDVAQSFTSGGTQSSYWLDSVDLSVKKGPTSSGDLTVSIHAHKSSGDEPGALLYTYTSPANLAAGTRTFSAPDHTSPLAGSTKYWVRVAYTGGGVTPELWQADTTDEDSSSASGWSIGDTKSNFIGGDWVEIDGDPIKIRVNGSTEPKYVSNTGQTSASGHVQAGTNTHAQGFATGGGPVGFFLGSIDLDVKRAPGSGTLKVTVREQNSSDKPGDLKYVLSNPPVIGTGIQRFHAPEGAWLDRNTNYYVRIVYTGGGTQPRFKVTASGSEDSGSYSGWIVFQDRNYRPQASGSWTAGANPIKISVNAPGADPPAPAAPTNLSAVAGTGQISVSWDNPENISIRKYQYNTESGASFSHMNGSNQDTTSFTVQNLTNGVEYTLAIRASNLTGEGSAATVTATPRWAAPADLTATPGDRLVTLNWTDPGMSGITKYQYSTNGGSTFTDISGSSATTTSYTVTSLNRDTEYNLAVRFLKENIYSEAAVVTTTTPTLPGPADLVATRGDRSLALEWTDPGMSGITKYQYSTNGGSTFTDISGSSATTTSYTVTGLSHGTEYTVAIRFADQYDYSEAATVTATTLLAPPSQLVAARDAGRVVLQWNTGNSAVTGYLVRTRVTGSNADISEMWIPASSGTKTIADITGLTNGTQYTFSVMAAIASGETYTVTGVGSTVNKQPESTLPAAPASLEATAGNRLVELSWDDPGDITITGYQYSTDSGSTFIEIPGSGRESTGYTITGLSGNTLYTFALRASNYSGDGQASLVNAEPLAGSVLVSNTGKSYNASTSEYHVAQEFTTGGDAAGYHLSSIKLRLHSSSSSNLTVTVRSGGPSGTVLYTLSNPSNLGSGTRTFKAPANAYLEPDTSYFVRMSHSSQGRPTYRMTIDPDEDSSSYPGWSIANSHRVRNDGNWGTQSWSVLMGVNTFPRPASLVATPYDGRVVLQWDTEEDRITHYRVRFKTLHGSEDPSYNLVPTSGSDRSAAEVTGLTNGTEYIFTVMPAAVSGDDIKGLSAHSSVTGTPTVVPASPIPAAPKNLTATPADGQATLVWDLDITVNKYRILVVPEVKLTADNGAYQDYFGYSVDLDDDAVVVGAFGDDHSNKTNAGSAYFYTKNYDGTWTQQVEIRAPESYRTDQAQYGVSVAVDGNRALTGGHQNSGSPGFATYSKRNSSGTWSGQIDLLPTTGLQNGDWFGYSVALDGNTGMVGAPKDDNDNGDDAGSVYYYEKENGEFSSLEQQLTASDGAAGDQFGGSLAVEGNTAVIGAYRDDSSRGSAYVFTKDSQGDWSQAAKLTASDRQTGDLSGGSVAIEGDTVVVGAFTRNEGGWTGSGAVYIFEKPQGGWANSTETAKLTAYDPEPTQWFGRSVGVNGDRIWVGAPGSDDQFDGDGRGAIYVFTKPASGWTNVDMTSADKLMASDGTLGDQLGQPLVIDGDNVVAGARKADGEESETGAVYILDMSGEWADISGSGFATASHVITGLTNGTQYTFAVRAVNDAGTSPASTASTKPLE